MGLLELNKPKWRHKDPAVRLASIADIDPGETDILVQVARDDADQKVRQAAINRITDLATLSRLAEKINPEDLPVVTARRNTLLFDQIVACQDDATWQEILDKITSTKLLAKLAVHAEQPEIRLAAVHKIDDQHLLADILKQNCGKKPAMAAMEKITDEQLLTDLCESAANKTSRRLAADRLETYERLRNPVSEQEIRFEKLQALASEAGQLQNSPDMDGAAHRMDAIKLEWEKLDSEQIHPSRDKFISLYHDFTEKYKAVLDRRKIAQEKAATSEFLQDQLKEICSIIERVSCSTDTNAEAVKKQAEADWISLVKDTGSDIIAGTKLTKRFNDACRAFEANRKKIEREREHIKDIGNKCTAVQELIADNNLKKAASVLAKTKKSLGRIDFKYFTRSNIDKLVSEVVSELEQAESEFRSQNLSMRQKICTELEKLRSSEKQTHIEKKMQALQQEWQQLDKPGDAESSQLEKRYQKVVDELRERLKTLEHEKDWELWANLKLKEQLTKKVVGLDQEQNLETVVTVIKQSQAEWKNIGPVPPEKSQELWKTFQDACNRNFERAKPYLDELKIQRAEAMARREEICTLTESLAESNEWQKTAQTIKELQQEWKSLPRGPRRKEQKLYQQFRKACDRFFARRKEHYQHLDAERGDNLAAKEKLCQEAERLAAEPQIDYSGKFKRLQSDWKTIGPVPFKNKDVVWKRFRTACDGYFNWLNEQQLLNLKLKEELCLKVESLVSGAHNEEDQQDITGQITELQQQWKEIGPVPHKQGKDVWQRFQEPIDRYFKTRREQHEKEEKERRLNQDTKQELLARAEELASQGKNEETSLQLQRIQKEWLDIGPAPRESDKELNDRFQSLCDAYFADRRQYFIDLQKEQLENQKKKESLCLRLENILGVSSANKSKEQNKALSLAEELKLAMEDNFMLAGRRSGQKDIRDEVKRIREDWEKTGPVPPGQIKLLEQRYRTALDTYYNNQQAPKK